MKNVLKYQADYEYASENFSKSKAIYEVVFERSSGMSHVRDACEAITRCSLKLENFEEAFKWANKLVSQFAKKTNKLSQGSVLTYVTA